MTIPQTQSWNKSTEQCSSLLRWCTLVFSYLFYNRETRREGRSPGFLLQLCSNSELGDRAMGAASAVISIRWSVLCAKCLFQPHTDPVALNPYSWGEQLMSNRKGLGWAGILEYIGRGEDFFKLLCKHRTVVVIESPLRPWPVGVIGVWWVYVVIPEHWGQTREHARHSHITALNDQWLP